MNEKIRTLLKFFLFFIAAAWALHTFSKNFLVDWQFVKFLAEKSVPINSAVWFWTLRIHIILALAALLTGPFGFIERLRKRNIRLHRYFGRIYVISVLLNFIPSVYLAFFATGGVWSIVGFVFLNLIWAGTTFQAYRLIRRRQVQAHRRWMIRSYAVTLANLQLYVLKTVFAKISGFDYELAYTIAVWSCWACGLLLAELIIWKLSRRAAQKAVLHIDRTSAEPEINRQSAITIYRSKIMKILVIGAAGRTGRSVVEQAVAAGHEVTAFVRNAGEYKVEGVRVIEGDAADSVAMNQAVRGQDAVLDTIGGKTPYKKTTLESSAANTIITAMQHNGVRRLVVTSSIGEGESIANANFFVRLLVATFLRGSTKDKAAMVSAVKASNLDWMVLRPAVLTDDPSTGNVRVFDSETGEKAHKITRADLASFMIAQLSSNEHLHQAVTIANS